VSLVSPGGLDDRPRLAALALVASNLVPLAGVLALGWDLHLLLVVYWLESGIVGLSYLARILRAEGADDPDELPSFELNDTPVSAFVGRGNRAIARFFLGHYGVFWAVHGLFVLVGFGAFLGAAGLPDPAPVALAAVGLLASHAASYRLNFVGEREYERLGPVTLMVRPYRRVVALHLTIVLGGFVVGAVGSPVGALAVLVAVKTAYDLREHLREHRDARSSDGSSAEVGAESGSSTAEAP
jgi:hypothetical protein